MRDIAAELGVSVITVSKALRNQGRISEEMRKRIIKRAHELNYRPDLTAQSLATGRTYLIGMVVPDLMHPFFAAIAKHLASSLRQKGYSLVISSSDEDPDLELQEVESLIARRIDALVLASSVHSKGSEVFQRLQEQNVPFLLLDRPISGLSSHFVGSDHREIGEIATRHLIERGYRRIAHIGLSGLRTGDLRLTGFKSVMKEFRQKIREDQVILVDSGDERGEECGYTAMRKLLTLTPRPDAVFCYNDIIALGAQKAIMEAELRIPQDVALIGVSNLAGFCFWTPVPIALSSVDQDVPKLAMEAAKKILELQNHQEEPSPRQIHVPLQVIQRASS